MAEYTPQIDSQIAQLLRVRTTVTPDMISGVTEEQARSFLQAYVAAHPDEDLSFDGNALTAGLPSLSEEPATEPTTSSFLDEPTPGYVVPPAADVGTPGYTPQSPLPEKPSGWLWLLPIFLGWLGGIVAWAMVKDKNSRTARNMLITGVVISVLAACIPFGFGFFQGSISGSASTDTAWPATGQVTFYYFGTPG